MNETKAATASTPSTQPHTGMTTRHDTWWLAPLLVATGFTLFVIYATYRAFENNYYEIGSIISPFYSPKIDLPGWPLSPALLILWMPAGFRATCYYYRKAYYRAYFLTPPACGVKVWGNKAYTGERAFPFVLQNLHRYFFYLAVLVLAILWYDAFKSMLEPKFHLDLVTVIMFANCFLLSGYTFGCHAYRHLAGGGLNCFSTNETTKRQFKVWEVVTKLNEHHMAWAWFSLFSVGFTDFYIRQVCAGAFPNPVFF